MKWSTLWWVDIATGKHQRCLCALHGRPVYTKGSTYACVDCRKPTHPTEDKP